MAVAQRAAAGSLLIRRWLGTWVDFLVLFVGIIIVGGLGRVIGGVGSGPAVLGLCLMAVFAYFIVGEAVWGRSVGKLVTGLVVVDEAGRPPGYTKALVRTLARLVEVNPLLIGGLPAGICLLATPHKQRVGDLLASTYVVPLADLKRATDEASVFA
jgi:uncharacterized RDD family membrane protein YckC